MNCMCSWCKVKEQPETSGFKLLWPRFTSAIGHMAAMSMLPGVGNIAISWLKLGHPPLVVFSVPLIPQPSLLCPVSSPLLRVEPLSRCLAALPEAAQHHCNV